MTEANAMPAEVDAIPLTQKAIDILVAVHDREGDDGRISAGLYYGGAFLIHAGGKTFSGDSAREQRAWKEALQELVDGCYIEKIGKSSYELTTKGWDYR